MKIYFIRHGESQANTLHVISNRGLRHPLTPKGRAQASGLARRLQPLGVTHIYTSPLLRAIETTVIVANHLGVEYTVSNALREYDCGGMEGRSDEAAWAAWQELFDAWRLHQHYDQRIPGGESFAEIRQRFVPFIESLQSEYGSTPANLVCISHGGLYIMLLPLVIQGVTHDFILEHGFNNTAGLVCQYTPSGLEFRQWL